MIKRFSLLLFSLILLSASLFAVDAEMDKNYTTVIKQYTTPEITVEAPVINTRVCQEEIKQTLKPKVSASSHLYGETVMLYGYPTVGGTWDFGLRVDTVAISMYTRYLHFFRPLGSVTGRLAVAEEMTEMGLSFKVKLYELGKFNASIGINTGWYQQWLMFGSNAGTYNMINNGMMVRPEVSIGWNFISWWNVELGLFFQTPLYPSYEGYSGIGAYLKIV